jgi:uncharacterized protein (DUF1810 family)
MIERFVLAQDRAFFEGILAELQAGRKSSHWMWFVFPQLKGMGTSYNAEYYGLEDLDEAKAYLAHPVLNQRLQRCCEALLSNDHLDIRAIMGSNIDVLKLQSSMTLFERAAPDAEYFAEVLEAFFAGQRCGWTLKKVES